jgi:hypothetical protein
MRAVLCSDGVYRLPKRSTPAPAPEPRRDIIKEEAEKRRLRMVQLRLEQSRKERYAKAPEPPDPLREIVDAVKERYSKQDTEQRIERQQQIIEHYARGGEVVENDQEEMTAAQLDMCLELVRQEGFTHKEACKQIMGEGWHLRGMRTPDPSESPDSKAHYAKPEQAAAQASLRDGAGMNQGQLDQILDKVHSGMTHSDATALVMQGKTPVAHYAKSGESGYSNIARKQPQPNVVNPREITEKDLVAIGNLCRSTGKSRAECTKIILGGDNPLASVNAPVTLYHW